MPNNFKYRSGLSSMGAYQVSAIPYATSSVPVPELGAAPLEITFPRITKFITVRNTIPTASAAAPLRVGFASVGTSGSVAANQNYFVLANGESYTGEWRVASIYLVGDTVGVESTGSVIAGITTVDTEELTGTYSNWSGSAGVG